MGTDNKRRYEHIDYAKGLGILLIMFAHVVQNFSTMVGANSFVRAFHVPVFFIASGCLFSYRYICINGGINESIELATVNKGEFIKKRAKGLLIPYAIFSIFNSLLKFAVLSVTGGISRDAVKEEMVQLLITGNGTVWFLMTLFLTELLIVLHFSSLGKIRTGKTRNSNSSDNVKNGNNYENSRSDNLNKNVYLLFMIFLKSFVLIILAFCLKDIPTPFGIVLNRVIAALGYYLLGMGVGSLGRLFEICRKPVVGTVLFLAGTLSWKLLGCDVDFFGGHFDKLPGSITASICLSVGTIILLYNLERVREGVLPGVLSNTAVYIKQVFEYFGKNSLIAMLVHPTILLFITYPFGGLLYSLQGAISVLLSVSVFILLAVLQIPFIWFINKYAPFIIGK